MKATITVPSLKVAVPLPANTLPRNLVPVEGPAGEPIIELVLEGGSFVASAKVNGKNYRKMLKTIDENGPDSVAIALQGILRPPATKGGPFVLDSAGFQCNVKTPRPDPTQVQ